jgi:hypothetical protein
MQDMFYARAYMVVVRSIEHLGLMLKAPERIRMDYLGLIPEIFGPDIRGHGLAAAEVDFVWERVAHLQIL